MGINSENNNENLKQQEEMASASNAATAGAKAYAKATEDTTKTTIKLGGKFEELTKGADDLLNTAEKLDRAFNLLPRNLSELTETMNKNMAYTQGKLHDSFFKGLINDKFWKIRKELGEETEELRQAAEAAEAALEIAQKSNDEQAKATAQNLVNQTKAAYKARKDATVQQQLNKRLMYDLKQSATNMITNLVNDIWKYWKQLYADGYKNTVAAIEQNYGTITSISNYSEAEFNALFKRINTTIEDLNLDKLITNADIEKALSDSLGAGLKEDQAFYNAFYSQLSAQMGITIDWMGSEFTAAVASMTEEESKLFMQHTAISLDAVQEIYDHNLGLRNGMATTISEFTGMMTRTYDLNEKAASNLFDTYLIASQELSKYDPDLASNIMTDISKMIETGLYNNQAASIFFTEGGTSEDLKKMLAEGRTSELVATYIDNAQKMVNGQNGEMLGVLSDQLGAHSAINYQALKSYTNAEGQYSQNQLEKISKLTGSIDGLVTEAHDYTLRTEQVANEKENNDIVQGLALLAAENPGMKAAVDSVTGSLGDIEKLLTTWMHWSMTNQVFNLFGKGGSGGNLISGLKNFATTFKNGSSIKDISKVFNTGAYSFKDVAADNGVIKAGLGKVGSLLNNGTAFASKGGSLAKVGSKVFSTGGKALGVAGSLISMGLDAYSGYKENGVEGALRGALTGSGKASESGWDVAKGAGSAALKGAGIGMIFGPWGAAIGAAVGAVAGLTTTIIDYNSEESKRARAFTTLNKYIESSSEALKIHAENTQKINELNEISEKSKKGDLASTEELVKKYPVLAKYVDQNGKTTEKYDEVLNQLMETEKRKLAAEVVDNYSKDNKLSGKMTSDSARSTQKAQAKAAHVSEISTIASDASNNQTKASYHMAFSAGGDLEVSPAYDKSADEILEEGHKKFGISKDAWDTMTDKEKAGFLKQKGFIGDYKRTGGKDGETRLNTAISGDSFTEYLKQDTTVDYSDLKAYYDAALNSVGLFNSLNTYETLADADLWLDGDKQDIVDKMNAAIINYNAVLKYGRSTDAGLRQAFKDVTGYNTVSEWVSATFGKDDPQTLYTKFGGKEAGIWNPYDPVDTYNLDPAKLAVGTNYIPYDNYLALLHRGEQVRTSAEVALEEANKHIASSTTSKAIHDVVLNQTNTIISILTNIYEALAGSSKSPVPKAGTIKYDLPGI